MRLPAVGLFVVMLAGCSSSEVTTTVTCAVSPAAVGREAETCPITILTPGGK